MFKKEDVIEVVNSNSILKEYGVLVCGSSLIMVDDYEEKQVTGDIDINIEEENFEKVREELASKFTLTDNSKHRVAFDIEGLGEVEVISDGNGTKVGEYVTTVDGIKIQTMKDIIEWKKGFGREKDYNDIEKINKYLNSK